MSHRIDSELDEKQIEADVASYLGYITPLWSSRYRLISVDEQTTGADKLFDRFVPIYLQFKVSQGLDPNVTIMDRWSSKPLPKIIKFRKDTDLHGNPILYFKLREMADNATELQHNILRKFHKPPNQYALYIAPLTLNYEEYTRLLNVGWYHKLISLFPFGFRPYEFRDFDFFDRQERRKILVETNPFLRGHISIPPLIEADTANHHYSFAKNGGSVAWHGGEILRDDYRLSNQLSLILSHFYNSDSRGFNLYSYTKFIKEFNGEHDETSDNSREELLQTIISFSRALREQHQIHLMLLSLE